MSNNTCVVCGCHIQGNVRMCSHCGKDSTCVVCGCYTPEGRMVCSYCSEDAVCVVCGVIVADGLNICPECDDKMNIPKKKSEKLIKKQHIKNYSVIKENTKTKR